MSEYGLYQGQPEGVLLRVVSDPHLLMVLKPDGTTAIPAYQEWFPGEWVDNPAGWVYTLEDLTAEFWEVV